MAVLPEKVQRFDLHQRIQHAMVAASFSLCGVTGWALGTATEPSSKALAQLFGGPLGCRLIHRGAGLVMILALFYHLAYLGAAAGRRKLSLDMLPAWHDVTQLFDNLRYLAGLRKDPPDFGRWSYIEKFDYFAGAWGKFAMGTTGLVLWFPITFSELLPGWAIQIAQLVHGREATIAILSLFVWHMYNVHIRPGVFPMSRVWLDGSITIDELRHHHPAEFRAMFPEAARATATPPKEEGASRHA